MGIDLLLLQDDKGGDLQSVLASQKKRFASEELVTETLSMYKEWTKSELALTYRQSGLSADFCVRLHALVSLLSLESSCIQPYPAAEEDERDSKANWAQEEGAGTSEQGEVGAPRS